jgi:NAD(P)-dependent dehydrogenase (short-subunit alcohol dehydrogenase family)
MNMTKKEKWTVLNIPDQTGKTILITGANRGLGFEDTKALAMKGAKVIMACRNLERANSAKETLLKEDPNALLAVEKLDLADFISIKEFASNFLEKYQQLDVLINNAALLMSPHQRTVQGFEMSFGVNHLGHFLLTGLLLPLLLKTPNSRIVNVSSSAHRFGNIHFEDINLEKKYGNMKAYGQSKLANLVFTYELQRQLSAAGKTTQCMASHPGFARTHVPNSRFLRFFNKLLSQSAEMGALPTLYAAVDPNAEGGKYYGPGGRLGVRGHPKLVNSSKTSKDLEIAKKLWKLSEELTEFHYDLS